MRSKVIWENIILILTLNIVFLSSMWNCNDKFDKMCEKYPQLFKILFKLQFKGNGFATTNIVPTADDIKSIRKGLWALFEITLVDNIDTGIDMNNDEIILKSIINTPFLFNNTPFISLFKVNNNQQQVYLFVSDIRTNRQGKEPESLFMKSDNIKKINVICSSNRRNSEDIRYLFSKCKKLEKVNLENLKLNGLIVDCLFYQCDKLEEIKLQKFNGDKNKVFCLGNLLYGVKSDESKGFIKLSCTEHFFSEIFTGPVEKASWRDDENNEKSFIPNYDWNKKYKKDLQNSNRYREFTLTFNSKENKKDAG